MRIQPEPKPRLVSLPRSATGLLRACLVWLSVPDYSPSGRALSHLAAVLVVRLHLRHPAGSGVGAYRWARTPEASARRSGLVPEPGMVGFSRDSSRFCFRRSAEAVGTAEGSRLCKERFGLGRGLSACRRFRWREANMNHKYKHRQEPKVHKFHAPTKKPAQSRP